MYYRVYSVVGIQDDKTQSVIRTKLFADTIVSSNDIRGSYANIPSTKKAAPHGRREILVDVWDDAIRDNLFVVFPISSVPM